MDSGACSLAQLPPVTACRLLIVWDENLQTDSMSNRMLNVCCHIDCVFLQSFQLFRGNSSPIKAAGTVDHIKRSGSAPQVVQKSREWLVEGVGFPVFSPPEGIELNHRKLGSSKGNIEGLLVLQLVAEVGGDLGVISATPGRLSTLRQDRAGRAPRRP